MVIWIIGLSGAGKTTLAKALIDCLTQHNINNCVMLDGDLVREAFQNDLGYSPEDRLKNANRIISISKILEAQGLNVIVPILNNSQEVRDNNRKIFKEYFEVFINTEVEVLKKRDQKNLYTNFERGLAKDIVGLDIQFQIPLNPDIVVDGCYEPNENAKIIFEKCFRKDFEYKFHRYDPKQEKELYMYSDCATNSFIKNYIETRNLFIKKLDSKNIVSQNILPFVLAEENEIANEINLFLKQDAISSLDIEKLKVFLLEVASTFEVKKRLYVTRGANGKFTNGIEVSTSVYIFIHYLMGKYLGLELDYRILSTMLKIGDFILFLSSTSDVNSMQSMAITSMETEKLLINSLLQ